MKNYKIAILPLYMKLHEKAIPEMHSRIEDFVKTIEIELKKRGVIVFCAPICGIKGEIVKAIKSFHKKKVDAIVTLHLTYSPSLESAIELAKTKLPIILLDTTPLYNFSPEQNPIEIMYNHGIHGVQDMCNVLLRKGKKFIIEAGHWQKSNVLDRIVTRMFQVKLVTMLCRTRVGIIGIPFHGMGDFQVSFDVLKDAIGIEVISCSIDQIKEMMPYPDDKEIENEIAVDKRIFSMDRINPKLYKDSLCVGIGVRRWIEKEKLNAFTMNALTFNKSSGLDTIPFLESSKAMARGIGYAAEGDVLTASLCGALLSVYSEVTFTEMFCPDWEHEAIFLSHVGEMNIRLTVDKPKLIEKYYAISDAKKSIIAVGKFGPGRAVLVNLAPGRGDTFKLILINGTMLDSTERDSMENNIRGWLKPDISVEKVLTEFSYLGGTHHSVLVYGDVGNDITEFGRLMSWEVISI